MDPIFIAVAGVIFLLWKSGALKAKPKAKKPKKIEAPAPLAPPIPDWLLERWKVAAADSYASMPKWYALPVTDRQLEKLNELGFRVSLKNMTRGIASDIIGLTQSPDADDLIKLKFFKVPATRMSQTEARTCLKSLFDDQKNKALWDNRAPDQLQKEYCKFFGIKLPASATHSIASALIAEHQLNIPESDPKTEQWEVIESVYSDLEDAETREDYDIKKVSFSRIKQAVQAYTDTGSPLEDCTTDDIVELILEASPKLEREQQ